MSKVRFPPRSLPALAAAIVAALVLGAPERALARSDAPLTGAIWVIPPAVPANPNVTYSADLKARTERLPPVSSITANHTAKVQLTFGPGDSYGAVAVERVTPAGAPVSCPTSGSAQVQVTCIAQREWLRTLTQDTTVQLRAKSTGNAIHYLSWTFIAPPNLVFLDRIEGPSSLVKGNVADFTLVLTEPAPAAGVTVTYQVDPGSCFVNPPYQRGRKQVVFQSGQQYKTLTLTSLASCTTGNAILKTWAHEQRDQAPYYLTKGFTLLRPRP